MKRKPNINQRIHRALFYVIPTATVASFAVFEYMLMKDMDIRCISVIALILSCISLLYAVYMIVHPYCSNKRRRKNKDRPPFIIFEKDGKKTKENNENLPAQQ